MTQTGIGRALALFAALALTIACAKEREPEKARYLTTFSAQLDDSSFNCPDSSATKAEVSVSTGKVSWEDGDEIAVTNGTAVSTFKYNASDKLFYTDTPIAYADHFSAVYPASIVKEVSGDSFQVSLPSSQTYYPDCVKKAPMSATSKTAEFHFNNLCAILVVKVSSDKKLSSMSFTANEVAVSGEGTISDNALTMAATGTKNIELETPQAVQLGENSELYLVLPAQVYTGGFALALNYSDGSALHESTTKTIALAAGRIDAMAAFSQTHFSGGMGTVTNPWKIATVEDLVFLSDNSYDQSLSYRNEYYEQVCDIDFKGANFTSIGRNLYFLGSYDGKGHKILNCNISNSGNPAGFFANLGAGGIVKNLTLEACTITANSNNSGGVVGYCNGGSVINCSLTKDCTVKQTVAAKHQLGGIVGSAIAASTITGCNFDGTVTGICGNVGGILGNINGTTVVDDCHVGANATITGGAKATESGCNIAGIVGYMNGAGSTATAIVKNCSFAGTVTAHWCDNAGIVGRLNNGTVTDCVSTGTINCDFDDSGFSDNSGSETSHSNTGGIVGWVSGSYSVLKNCTSKATVSAPNSRYVGGVIGFTNNGNISNCDFVDGTVTGVVRVGGIAGELYNYGVRACNVKNCTITASGGTGGGVVGYNYATMVSDCHFDEGSTLLGGGKSKHNMGGIAGVIYGYAAIVKECTVAGTIVPGSGIVGGAVGLVQYGLVRNTVLKSTAKVGSSSASFNFIGGMVGEIDSKGGYIIECTVEEGASISCPGYSCGGIVGYVAGNSEIDRCYVAGDVSSNSPIGGIVGSASCSSTLISNCMYYNGKITGTGDKGGVAGIIGKLESSATSPENIIVNCAAYPDKITYDKGSVSGITADPKGTVTNCCNSVDGGSLPTVSELNTGAENYNNSGTLLYAVRASEWVNGTNGKPVQASSPIAAEEPVKKKTKVGLLGDSISTFTGWTPYPKGNGYPLAKWPDVTTVDQVYWHILIYKKMTNCELDVNSAYSGSCLMNTTTYGYPGRSFLQRYVDLKNPDIILINGGTNDCSYGSGSLPMGKSNFDLPDDQLDTYSFAGAYDMLIRVLQKKFPGVKICLICGDVPRRSSTTCKQIIKEVAEHYDLPYAEITFDNLSTYTEDNTHPNAKGHALMADQIWDQIKDKL